MKNIRIAAVSSSLRRAASNGLPRRVPGTIVSPMMIMGRTLGSFASGGMSFTSPEADFTAQGVRDAVWKNCNIKMSSTAHEHRSSLIHQQTAKQQQRQQEDIASRYSFTSPESDFTSQYVRDGVTGMLLHPSGVPKTFREALLERHAAIVVTTATSPHTIIYVNRAWENMCGYTLKDVMGETFDCIQGPETNQELVHSKVQQLENDRRNNNINREGLDMYLMNYRKNGEKFINHLTIGTMTLNDEVKDVEFMVGVLEEVPSKDAVPLRMI